MKKHDGSLSASQTSCIFSVESSLLPIKAWELSTKMQLLAAVKLTFHREKNCLWGKEIGGKKKKKKESTGFSSALKTGEI